MQRDNYGEKIYLDFCLSERSLSERPNKPVTFTGVEKKLFSHYPEIWAGRAATSRHRAWTMFSLSLAIFSIWPFFLAYKMAAGTPATTIIFQM